MYVKPLSTGLITIELPLMLMKEQCMNDPLKLIYGFKQRFNWSEYLICKVSFSVF